MPFKIGTPELMICGGILISLIILGLTIAVAMLVVRIRRKL